MSRNEIRFGIKSIETKAVVHSDAVDVAKDEAIRDNWRELVKRCLHPKQTPEMRTDTYTPAFRTSVGPVTKNNTYVSHSTCDICGKIVPGSEGPRFSYRC